MSKLNIRAFRAVDRKSKQSFALHVGSTYVIAAPRDKKPGVIYCTGHATLLAVYANGTARFESNASKETFIVNLSDNRVFLF
jgi:hypothetical protein